MWPARFPIAAGVGAQPAAITNWAYERFVMAKVDTCMVGYWEDPNNLRVLSRSQLREFRKELRAVIHARELGVRLEHIQPKPDLVELDLESLSSILRSVLAVEALQKAEFV